MQMRIILTTMYIETFIVQSIGTNPCSWCRSLLTAKLNFSLDLNDIRVISEDIGSLVHLTWTLEMWLWDASLDVHG
uniref:Uncharacterized protein n=1 Tax=Oryza nivara TaxID=4536 RepID=A0A0E0J6E0_ORYNI